MTREDRVEVLKHVYEDVVTERNRLRDARAGFTSRLGPLPASAAIVIGLTGTAADKVDRGWILAAGVLFGLLVFVSSYYGGLPSYRLLRARDQQDGELRPGSPATRSFAFAGDASDLAAWLEGKIALEERICGALRSRQSLSLRRSPTDLQEALDVERTAFLVVQSLFAAIIIVVVAGVVTH